MNISTVANFYRKYIIYISEKCKYLFLKGTVFLFCFNLLAKLAIKALIGEVVRKSVASWLPAEVEGSGEGHLFADSSGTSAALLGSETF
jgi:hypothetical protein